MKPSNPQYEPTDAGRRPPLLAGALLLGVMAAALVAVYLVFHDSSQKTDATQPGSRYADPVAPLDGIARTWETLAEERRQRREVQTTNTVSIDEAFATIARRGLPHWPPPENPTPPIPTPDER